jgi:membrane-associated phospholipid phosphatase
MRALVAMLVVAIPGAAAAQTVPEPEPVVADVWVDGGITVGAGLAALALSRLPVDVSRTWKREVLGGLDHRVRDDFSATAAGLSDVLVAISIGAPLFTEVGAGIDEHTDDRLLVYTEGLAVTTALNFAAKYLVQRPRPYAYNPDPSVLGFAAAEGKDSRLSFYSGHAAIAFTAAISGGYLYAARTDDVDARTAVWASGATLASATAIMRVRAGKHFYSDVLFGAALGAIAGWVVPRLHHQGGVALDPQEWAAIGGGVVLGAAVAQLVPLPNDVVVELGALRATDVALQPLAVDGGGGLALGGALD